jgi:hypothetical protein
VAESVTVTVRVKVDAESGLKVMLRVQLAAAASEEPQVLAVWVKSDVFPESTTLLSVAEALPVLVTVTACAALVWPTVVLGKVSEVAETVRKADVLLPPPPLPLDAGALFDPQACRKSEREQSAESAESLRSIGDLWCRRNSVKADYRLAGPVRL